MKKILTTLTIVSLFTVYCFSVNAFSSPKEVAMSKCSTDNRNRPDRSDRHDDHDPCPNCHSSCNDCEESSDNSDTLLQMKAQSSAIADQIVRDKE